MYNTTFDNIPNIIDNVDVLIVVYDSFLKHFTHIDYKSKYIFNNNISFIFN